MRVAVIVCNWNGGEHVLRCLRALERQTYRDFRAIVVDNASTDGSPERIAEEFPGVTLLRCERNLGFAAANNLAIRAAQECEWIALLNPDAFADENWLKELLAAAERHPECASVGSRMLRADDPGTLDGIGDVYHLSGLAWREGFGKSAAGRGLKPKEIFSPCAAAALYRASVLREVEGFDEDYFCYAEDVDLGFRMRLLGYSSWYAPGAVVGHIGSATTGSHSDFTLYHGFRNVVWTYLKNMPAILFWLCLPAHLAALTLLSINLCLQGQGHVAWRALRDALLGSPRILRKRRLVQSRRRVSTMAVWRFLDKTPPGMRK